MYGSTPPSNTYPVYIKAKTILEQNEEHRLLLFKIIIIDRNLFREDERTGSRAAADCSLHCCLPGLLVTLFWVCFTGSSDLTAEDVRVIQSLKTND